MEPNLWPGQPDKSDDTRNVQEHCSPLGHTYRAFFIFWLTSKFTTLFMCNGSGWYWNICICVKNMPDNSVSWAKWLLPTNAEIFAMKSIICDLSIPCYLYKGLCGWFRGYPTNEGAREIYLTRSTYVCFHIVQPGEFHGRHWHPHHGAR